MSGNFFQNRSVKKSFSWLYYEGYFAERNFFCKTTPPKRIFRGFIMEGVLCGEHFFAEKQKTFAKIPNEKAFSPLISEGCLWITQKFLKNPLTKGRFRRL